jgi:hypothetical protein
MFGRQMRSAGIFLPGCILNFEREGTEGTTNPLGGTHKIRSPNARVHRRLRCRHCCPATSTESANVRADLEQINLSLF